MQHGLDGWVFVFVFVSTAGRLFWTGTRGR